MSETITVPNTGTEAALYNRKNMIIKNCVLFTDCISETNNTQIDTDRDTDTVMLMHNLIEYSDNSSKTSGSLWQYYTDDPALNNDGNIISFHAAGNNSDSFKFKTTIASKTGKGGTVKVMVPLKYLSGFWRTLEMALINSEIKLILPCSANCFIIAGAIDNQVPTFTIADTKFYVPVVTLSTQINEKL